MARPKGGKKKTCERCDKKFLDPPRVRGRPRKYCLDCIQKAQREKDLRNKQEKRRKRQIAEVIKQKDGLKKVEMLMQEWSRRDHQELARSRLNEIHPIFRHMIKLKQDRDPILQKYDDAKKMIWSERDLAAFMKRYIEENWAHIKLTLDYWGDQNANYKKTKQKK